MKTWLKWLFSGIVGLYCISILVILAISHNYKRCIRAMILVFKHLFYRNYVGLSLWPFIILKNTDLKRDLVLINHEKIHLQQQKELLIIPFYLLYFAEWIVRSLLYLDFYKGYQNISFEREAYFNEKNLNYLEQRSAFGFLRYVNIKKLIL